MGSLEIITVTLFTLSSFPTTVIDSEERILEQFTVLMYDKTLNCSPVNAARKIIFCQKGRAIDRLPPNQGALMQHIRRAAYQAGHVWSTSLVKDAHWPSPTEWGWKMETNVLRPLWTELPEVSRVSQQLIKCRCQERCNISRCRCLRSSLPCTDLCRCGGCQL